jgi:hypothetical protein
VAVVVSVAVVAIAAGIFTLVASVRMLLSASAAWASLSESSKDVAAVAVTDRVPASSSLWLAPTASGSAFASASGAAWVAVVELDLRVASGISPAEGSWMHVTSEASALLLGCSTPGVPGTSGGGDMHVDPA